MAPMPVLTLLVAASPRDSSEWPRRQPMNTAIIVATTSATWFGPTGAGIAEQEIGQRHQQDEAGDRNDGLGQREGLRGLGSLHVNAIP